MPHILWYLVLKVFLNIFIPYSCQRCRDLLKPNFSNYFLSLLPHFQSKKFAPESRKPTNSRTNLAHKFVYSFADDVWLTDTNFFFCKCPLFKLKRMTFRKPVLLPLWSKEAPNLTETLNWAILRHWVPEEPSNVSDMRLRTDRVHGYKE